MRCVRGGASIFALGVYGLPVLDSYGFGAGDKCKWWYGMRRGGWRLGFGGGYDIDSVWLMG